MKQLFFLAVLSMFIIVSCSQEDEMANLNAGMEDVQLDLRGGDKVDVCHNGMIINVSVNSLGGHQGHGDAVDMDGDGFFDKDNECGPTDCDDSDPSLTDNCCPEELGFCEYLDMWGFDAECDQYCDYNYTWNYDDDYYGCEYNGTQHSTYIYTDDYYYGDCDGNGNNIYGYIYAGWGTYTYCDDDYIWGEISYYLYDYDLGEYVLESYSYDNTQEAYDAAMAAGPVIEEIAADLGMLDQCEDYDYTPLISNEGDNQVHADNAGSVELGEEAPMLHRTISNELRNKITQRTKGEELKK